MTTLVIIVVIAILVLLIYMWQEARKNNVVYTEKSFCSLPKQFSGMKLFFISDIHYRVVSEKIIEKIKGQVDIIIIGGDLTEKGVPFDRVNKNVKLLSEVAPTYFVWGNNDHEVNKHQLKKILFQHGVVILANQAFPIIKGNEKIYLIGVDDFGHRFDNLELALKDCKAGFRILISHNPNIKKKIQESFDIKLILSGHTHGGQIRFLGLGIMEKAGWKKLSEELYLLVSNGYGTTRLHLRLGAPCETHIITLKTK